MKVTERTMATVCLLCSFMVMEGKEVISTSRHKYNQAKLPGFSEHVTSQSQINLILLQDQI